MKTIIKVLILCLMMWFLASNSSEASVNPDRKAKREQRKADRIKNRIGYQAPGLPPAEYSKRKPITPQDKKIFTLALVGGLIIGNAILNTFGDID